MLRAIASNACFEFFHVSIYPDQNIKVFMNICNVSEISRITFARDTVISLTRSIWPYTVLLRYWLHSPPQSWSPSDSVLFYAE